MRRILLTLILGIFLMSFVSADIIIGQQPNDMYNLGNSVSVPVTIKATSDLTGSLSLDLVCNGQEINFYRNGINLGYGEEVKISPSPSVVLTRNVIGNTLGRCKIKAQLNDEIVFTNEFRISNILTINLAEHEESFSPDNLILLDGDVLKEDGEPVNGFIELEILDLNSSTNITQLSPVNEGLFQINFTLPKNIKAGDHPIVLRAYELDGTGEKTNQGLLNEKIKIKQIPTNIEIITDENPVEPGTNLNVRAILRDQTGEKIESTVRIKIENEKNKLMEEKEIKTDESLEYAINYNEPISKWKITAQSEGLESTYKFDIGRKEEIAVHVLNETVIVENVGNVDYCNKTIVVKIGKFTENINVCLGVDESERYILKAPNGQYDVEVMSEGQSLATQSGIGLTGKAVSIEKAYGGVASLARYPLVWIFLVAVIGFVAFLIFKKGYKRALFGHLPRKKKISKSAEKMNKIKEDSDLKPLRKDSLIKTRNRAVLSLSLKGEKQRTAIIGLRIRNLKEIESKGGNIEESLQKIVSIAEGSQAYIYENMDHLFFLIAPSITKTFKNEIKAIKLAEEIEKILKNNNRMFRHRFDYGLVLNSGEIVAKIESGTMKFVSMETLIPSTKRLTALGGEKILLTKEFNERLTSSVKTERQEKEGYTYYTIREVVDREEHKQFLSNLVKKLENEKRENKK